MSRFEWNVLPGTGGQFKKYDCDVTLTTHHVISSVMTRHCVVRSLYDDTSSFILSSPWIRCPASVRGSWQKLPPPPPVLRLRLSRFRSWLSTANIPRSSCPSKQQAATCRSIAALNGLWRASMEAWITMGRRHLPPAVYWMAFWDWYRTTKAPCASTHSFGRTCKW